jgi:hypothetical protein
MTRCVAAHGIVFSLFLISRGAGKQGGGGASAFSPFLPFSSASLPLLKLFPHSTSIFATLEQEARYV